MNWLDALTRIVGLVDDFVWGIADIVNGLMAIPNMIALIALSGVVVETRSYFRRLASGEIEE